MIGRFVNNIFRIFKYTVQHLTRNAWQSLSVVLIMAVTFMFVQLFIVATMASDKILQYFEKQPQVTVFFKDEASEDQILQIKKELEKDPDIQEIKYISKDQAVEIYKSLHQDEPELLEFVTADILPASLEISATQVTRLSTVALEFEQNQLVERVFFQRDLVEELTRWTNTVRQAGIVLVAVLTFISAVLIVLVISRNVSSFSREIEIMKLVGAGSWFIRWPFVLDGAFFAVLASLMASIGSYYLLPYIEEFSQNFILAIELFPPRETLIPDLWLLTSAAGVLFTGFISFFASWKYLRG